MAGIPSLVRYRHQKGLTQEALGKELEVTGVAISRWETGERKIDRGLLPKVSAITGIPKRELRPDLAALMDDEGAAA